MDKPILYIFNISHYCEKARGALDHFGIAHQPQHVMVGTHRRIYVRDLLAYKAKRDSKRRRILSKNKSSEQYQPNESLHFTVTK